MSGTLAVNQGREVAMMLLMTLSMGVVVASLVVLAQIAERMAQAGVTSQLRIAEYVLEALMLLPQPQLAAVVMMATTAMIMEMASSKRDLVL